MNKTLEYIQENYKLIKFLKKLTNFCFSDIEKKEGYTKALQKHCELKREASALINAHKQRVKKS